MTNPRHLTAKLLSILTVYGMLSSFAYAQVARLEVRPFQSLTLTDKQFLQGAHDGKQITLGGELRIPRAGTDKLPAVIFLQPSGGFGSNMDLWLREMGNLGIATYVVDSFTGRGIFSMTLDQDQLGQLAEIYDAYRALEDIASIRGLTRTVSL
jgi:hypothetical protein